MATTSRRAGGSEGSLGRGSAQRRLETGSHTGYAVSAATASSKQQQQPSRRAQGHRDPNHQQRVHQRRGVPIDDLSDMSDDSDVYPSTLGAISTVTPSHASSVADDSGADAAAAMRPVARGDAIQTRPVVASSRYQAILDFCIAQPERISFSAFGTLLRRCNVNADEQTVSEHFARAIDHDSERAYADADKAAREIHALGGTLPRRDATAPAALEQRRPRRVASPTTTATTEPIDGPSDDDDDRRPSSTPQQQRPRSASPAALRGSSQGGGGHALRQADTNRPPMRFGRPDEGRDESPPAGGRKAASSTARGGTAPLAPAAATDVAARNQQRHKSGFSTINHSLSSADVVNLVNRLTRDRRSSRLEESRIAVEERKKRAIAEEDEECTFHPTVFNRSRQLSQRAIGDGTCAEVDRFRKPTESFFARQAQRSTESLSSRQQRRGGSSSSMSPTRGRSPNRKGGLHSGIGVPGETPHRRIAGSRPATYDENGAVTSADYTFAPTLGPPPPRNRSPSHEPKGYYEAICRMRRVPSQRASSPTARFEQGLRSGPPSPGGGGGGGMSPSMANRPRSTFGNEGLVDPMTSRFDMASLVERRSATASRSPPRIRDGPLLDRKVAEALDSLRDLFGDDFAHEIGGEGMIEAAIHPPEPSASIARHRSRRHSASDASAHNRSNGGVVSASGNTSVDHSSSRPLGFKPFTVSSRAYIRSKVDQGLLDVEDAPYAFAAFKVLEAAALARHHDPAPVPRTDDHERVVRQRASPHRGDRRYGVDASTVTMSRSVAGAMPRYATPIRAMSPRRVPLH